MIRVDANSDAELAQIQEKNSFISCPWLILYYRPDCQPQQLLYYLKIACCRLPATNWPADGAARRSYPAWAFEGWFCGCTSSIDAFEATTVTHTKNEFGLGTELLRCSIGHRPASLSAPCSFAFWLKCWLRFWCGACCSAMNGPLWRRPSCRSGLAIEHSVVENSIEIIALLLSFCKDCQLQYRTCAWRCLRALKERCAFRNRFPPFALCWVTLSSPSLKIACLT